MTNRFTLPYARVFDATGLSSNGAKLTFYETGTTTPLDTYSDEARTIANTNPVVANSEGRFGSIFLKDQKYKVLLNDSDDNLIWTADPVIGTNDASNSSVTIEDGTTGVDLTERFTEGAYPSPRDFGATGDGVADDSDALVALFAAATSNGWKTLNFPKRYTYLYDMGALTIPSGTELIGGGTLKCAASYTVTGLTGTLATTAAVVTYTKNDDSPVIAPGDFVSIKGASDAAYNGYFEVLTSGTGTFTYAAKANIGDATPSGTIVMGIMDGIALANDVVINDIVFDFNSQDTCLYAGSSVTGFDIRKATFKNTYFSSTVYHVSSLRDVEFGCFRAEGTGYDLSNIYFNNVHSGIVLDNPKDVTVTNVTGDKVGDIGITIFSDGTDTNNVTVTNFDIRQSTSSFQERGITADVWGGNSNSPATNYALPSTAPWGIKFINVSMYYGTGAIFTSNARDCQIIGGRAENCIDVGFDAEGSRNVSYSNTISINCKNGGLAAFYLCDGITFSNCVVSINDSTPYQIQHIIRAQSNFGYPGNSIKYEGCTFSDDRTGTYPERMRFDTGRTGVKFDNCVFRNVLFLGQKANDSLQFTDCHSYMYKYGTSLSPFQFLAPGQSNGIMKFEGGLIENTAGQGDYVSAVAVAAGGTGYTSADLGAILTIATGGATEIDAKFAQIYISEITGGSVTGVALVPTKKGAYVDSTALASPNTVTGSTVGSGLTVTLTTARGGVGLYEVVITAGGAAYIAGDEDVTEALVGGTSSTTAQIKIKTVAAGAVTEAGIAVQDAGIYRGGTGYTATDVLTVSTDTGTAIDSDLCTITADTVDGDGVITAVTLTTGGAYSRIPISPVSVTGGTGSGALFVLDTGRYTVLPSNTASVANASTTGNGLTIDCVFTGAGITVDRDAEVSRNYQPFEIRDVTITGFFESIYMNGLSASGSVAYHKLQNAVCSGNLKGTDDAKANYVADKCVQLDGETPVYIESIGNSGAFYGYTAATYDPNNLADGAGETNSFTVLGAALGDIAYATAPYDLQDLILTAYVQSANTVETRLQNESTGAIDLASGTWTVWTKKQP